MVGVVTGFACYYACQRIWPGAGDFGVALETAGALIAGRDPYDFEPNAAHVPYPLPVALFGLPFLSLTPSAAAATFIGLSATLLTWGVCRQGQLWRLLLLLSWPFLDAVIVAQWTPLITSNLVFPAVGAIAGVGEAADCITRGTKPFDSPWCVVGECGAALVAFGLSSVAVALVGDAWRL